MKEEGATKAGVTGGATCFISLRKDGPRAHAPAAQRQRRGDRGRRPARRSHLRDKARDSEDLRPLINLCFN